jgi:hypothetical protein
MVVSSSFTVLLKVSHGPGAGGAPLLVDTSGSLYGLNPVVVAHPGRSVKATLHVAEPEEKPYGLYDMFERFVNFLVSIFRIFLFKCIVVRFLVCISSLREM